MSHKATERALEFAVIGAGPAAITALAKLIQCGVKAETILWIDPYFRVGDFGRILSRGSSVPGNTTVLSYQRVNHEIYNILSLPRLHFQIDDLEAEVACFLNIATEPLQYITNQIRTRLLSVTGWVTHINTINDYWEINIKLTPHKNISYLSRRVILATGAQAKTIALPIQHKNITMIAPTFTFIESELANYREQQKIRRVAVIGSSHSAALATMHLLQAGIPVTQFMNKEYKYARECETEDGTKYTLHDNTGLKGNVAQFTQSLLQSNMPHYHAKLIRHIANQTTDVSALLTAHLAPCSHAVATIGYERSQTLFINQRALSTYSYNPYTSEINNTNNLFGIGIAFPEKVTAHSGEVEFAVGVGKFWSTAHRDAILKCWLK